MFAHPPSIPSPSISPLDPLSCSPATSSTPYLRRAPLHPPSSGCAPTTRFPPSTHSPYFIDIFIWGQVHYLLGLFIQVEAATLVLNYQNLLEARKMTNSKCYAFTFYFGYVLWFVVRGIMPVYIVVSMMDLVEPVYGNTWTAAVCYGCAFFVVIFCNIVFLAILTPDVIAHCRGSKGQGEQLVDETDLEMDEIGGGPRRSVWLAPTEADGEAHFRSRASTIRV